MTYLGFLLWCNILTYPGDNKVATVYRRSSHKNWFCYWFLLLLFSFSKALTHLSIHPFTHIILFIYSLIPSFNLSLITVIVVNTLHAKTSAGTSQLTEHLLKLLEYCTWLALYKYQNLFYWLNDMLIGILGLVVQKSISTNPGLNI